MPVLVCENVAFYSQADEDAFFSWLERISCVRGVEGVGSELHVKISRRVISNSCLRELIAICFRYGITMHQLAQFETSANATWFRGNPSAFWHQHVFGSKETPVSLSADAPSNAAVWPQSHVPRRRGIDDNT
jgi:hypothetical protein